MKRLMVIVLVLAFVALFARLGFWQLSRAEEKRALLDAHSQRSQQAPLMRLPMQGDKAQIRYRRIHIAGRFDAARQILLDNRVYNGRVGYQVLTPLQPADGDCAVLVNRGWLPAAPSRSQLPALPITQIEAQVEGVIDEFPSVGFRLKGADALADAYPLVAQNVDATILAKRLGYCLAPYQILMVPGVGEGYVREWKMQHIDPDKSLGYAFQWFALSLGLAAYSAWIALRRRIPSPEKSVDEQS